MIRTCVSRPAIRERRGDELTSDNVAAIGTANGRITTTERMHGRQPDQGEGASSNIESVVIGHGMFDHTKMDGIGRSRRDTACLMTPI
jgi:hypothetical protein